MAIGSDKGRFYIYIYKDGIHIDFDIYNIVHGQNRNQCLGSYNTTIKYPTDMIDKVINLITDLETKFGNTAVIAHVYRNISIKAKLH